VSDSATLWLTTTLFAITYAGLAVGKLPGVRLDRPGIAFAGAALMLSTGLLTLDQATGPDSIDYETLFLLLGMMVVVGFLRLSGAFTRLTHWSLDRIHSPKGLLAAVVLLSGVLSAFLVNDIVCLALTPLVLHLTRRLGYEPVPHLIGLATAANIGSTGTITGNPQNMFIGAHSDIPYLRFALHLMPVALLGLAIDYVVIRLLYRRALSPRGAGPDAGGGERADSRTGGGRDGAVPDRPIDVYLQWKGGIVAAAAVVLFFLGLPVAVVAVGAAAVLMLGRVKPARIYRQIDGGLLLMFVGLFIVVHAFQLHVVSRWGVERWHALLAHPVGLLSVASAVLSNLVSNVPAVLLFKPVMAAVPPASQQTAWLALAMSSTLAGNLTVLGSVANLIVVERARREGVVISFWEYGKAGVPVTGLTLALGVAWLRFVHY
jgi:Na+/H+ antiporter NhaD/arsenite permease-like protein